MAVAVETALDLAGEFRSGRATCRPIQLWRAAHCEARGHVAARLVLFRHAMIHAGFLTTVKGKPYKRCPMCHRSLPT